MRVLVTGANGFAGRPLVAYLARAGFRVRAGVRDLASAPAEAAETVLMPDLSAPFICRQLVQDCDAVVHLAGLAHSSADIPQSVYSAVNAYAPQNFARACRDAGVKVFVHVSSVRAQCGAHFRGTLTEACEPRPSDAYGRSKLEGECYVRELLEGSQTACVILRPVLMYGPQAKGNMATLMTLARSRHALPLGGFPGRRSLVGIENFNSAVRHVLTETRCDGQTFLVAEKPPLTVGEIVTVFRKALGQPARVINVPVKGGGRLLSLVGRRDLALRLYNDLVASADALEATGWRPPVSTEEGLAQAISG